MASSFSGPCVRKGRAATVEKTAESPPLRCLMSCNVRITRRVYLARRFHEFFSVFSFNSCATQVPPNHQMSVGVLFQNVDLAKEPPSNPKQRHTVASGRFFGVINANGKISMILPFGLCSR